MIGVSAILSAFDAGAAVQDKDLLGEGQIGRSQEKKRNAVKVSRHVLVPE